MSWYEVYLKDIEKKDTLDKYVSSKIKNKQVFIKLIKKYSSNFKILEAGSGTGILSTYMASLNYDVTAIDIDKKILGLSQNISQNYNSNNKPTFLIKSIFKLDFKKEEFDVSFSNGVLEHFKDEEIISTLKQQMTISKFVIFGIPTKYFNQAEAMYGDERYMRFSKWRELIKQANGIILEEKSMQYTGYLERFLNFKKYFKPSPFRIFVIKKDEEYVND